MLAKLSRRRQFAIPKKLAEALHLKEGDLLKVEKKANSLLITPMELEERYDPEILKKAEKVLEKEAAQSKKFSSLEEMIDDLHKQTKKSPHGKK